MIKNNNVILHGDWTTTYTNSNGFSSPGKGRLYNFSHTDYLLVYTYNSACTNPKSHFYLLDTQNMKALTNVPLRMNDFTIFSIHMERESPF